MTKIGIISDTHSYLDEQVFGYFKDVDMIWHAGDIGTQAVTDQLKAFKPLYAVYGNIDDANIRHLLPEDLIFEAEGYQLNGKSLFDGTRNGDRLPADTYYYVLSYGGKEVKSSLTILWD